jgi:hypothetical protein
MAVSLMLLVQYGLGMGVNLYLSVPKTDQGDGIRDRARTGIVQSADRAGHPRRIRRATRGRRHQRACRAVISRHALASATSAIGVLAILGAVASGASFVNKDQVGAWMMMAVLTRVSLLCYLIDVDADQPVQQPLTAWATSPTRAW